MAAIGHSGRLFALCKKSQIQLPAGNAGNFTSHDVNGYQWSVNSFLQQRSHFCLQPPNTVFVI